MAGCGLCWEKVQDIVLKKLCRWLKSEKSMLEAVSFGFTAQVKVCEQVPQQQESVRKVTYMAWVLAVPGLLVSHFLFHIGMIQKHSKLDLLT